MTSRHAGEQADYPARDIVDAGFLELVRYGIRPPDDPIVMDSLKVIDATVKLDLLSGSYWHRYNHDNYGEREDGAPYESGGTELGVCFVDLAVPEGAAGNPFCQRLRW